MSSYNEITPSYGTTASSSNTLTAFFEDRGDAESAVERLVEAGISRDGIRLIAGKETTSSVADTAVEDKGFWAKLEDYFFPDDDRAAYSEGLRRGGYLVTVSGISASSYDAALDILDDEGSIDLDERTESWRSEGWTESQSRLDLSPSAYASAATASPETISDDDTYSDTASTSTAARDTSSSVRDASADEVIPVVAEDLRVGKRDVSNGRVRVRSYVVETPVSESVSLRDENVEIERRTVDRALSNSDNPFVDRTIEVEERHEEAVISKDARVVEEIALRKTAEQRDHTVTDTVRHTEVEVEDERADGTLRKDNNSTFASRD